jgi:predicted nucleic acid-binding protein
LIVVDTSGLLAAADEDHVHHRTVRFALDSERGPFLLSPFVLAEADYLLATRLGIREELLLLRAVADGEYQLESFTASEVASMADLVARYQDLPLGLADASLVVLAARARTDRILTLDQRHFRVVRPIHGGSFTILPADA